MASVGLQVGWCSAKASEYACKNWHYSKTMPCFKINCFGVWYDGSFVGSIIYGNGGGSVTNGEQYGLRRSYDMVELCRVALTKHTFQTSQAIAYSIRLLKKKNPNLKLIVSFADTDQGHHGGIYQAGGWIYTGSTQSEQGAIINGKKVHKRTLHSSYGTNQTSQLKKIDPNFHYLPKSLKHRYLMPLTKQMKKRIVQLSKPYPKRVSSDTSDTPAFHAGEAGATPSDALQKEGKQ